MKNRHKAKPHLKAQSGEAAASATPKIEQESGLGLTGSSDASTTASKELNSMSITFTEIVWRILNDWKVFARVGIIVICTAAITTGLCVCVFRLLRAMDPSMSIRVTTSGAVEILSAPDARTAMFLLSPNAGNDTPWVDTGVLVKANDKITIRASGRICMAYHRMVEAAQRDSLPPVPWTGPDGIGEGARLPLHEPRPAEKDRPPFRLAKSVNHGRLLASVSMGTPASEPRTLGSPEAKDLFSIGTEFSFTAPHDGNIWLTVNDIWLNDSMRELYEKTGESYNDKIAKTKYWNLWFDDNAGSFLVTIEVKTPE